MQTFSGAWAALVTPFTPDNEINLPVLSNLTSHLIDKGLDGFYVCGATGQGIFMTVEERKLVSEEWMRCGRTV